VGNETENTAYATAKSNTSSMTTKSSLKRKTNVLFVWADLAYKSWLKVLLAGLV